MSIKEWVVQIISWTIADSMFLFGLLLLATGIDAPDLFDSANREIWPEFVLWGGVLIMFGIMFIVTWLERES